MPNALRKRGVTRKIIYSEYIKRYPQGYFYCSFNRFLCAYIASHKSLFKVFVACGAPANRFLKVFALAGLPQIIPQKVWSFRAWRKSFPERFGISALGESHFPKGLTFPRSAKVVSRMVWCFRAWRKSFPERFGISALGESYFPNGLELVVAKIWKLTVQRNGHVRLPGHYYSVPHTYVGKKESMRKRKNIYERKQKKVRNHLQCKDIISIFAK